MVCLTSSPVGCSKPVIRRWPIPGATMYARSTVGASSSAGDILISHGPLAAGLADVEHGFLLPGFAEYLRELLDIQIADRDGVDADNLVAGGQAGLRGGRAFERLQHDHAARQQADDGAESFALARLHLLELLELIGIEEHRMRIEGAQHAGNRALVNRDVGRYGIGGFALDGRVHAGDLLEFLLDLRGIIGGQQWPQINANEREWH